eukprot:202859-Pyramimonas_sp.AAC.1
MSLFGTALPPRHPRREGQNGGEDYQEGKDDDDEGTGEGGGGGGWGRRRNRDALGCPRQQRNRRGSAALAEATPH